MKTIILLLGLIVLGCVNKNAIKRVMDSALYHKKKLSKYKNIEVDIDYHYINILILFIY